MILNYKCDSLSVKGNAKVTNEKNEVVYEIKGKLISITKKAKIYNKEHKLLYVVRKKFFKLFLKSALIYSNGKKIAKVTRKIAVKDNYTIKGFEQEVHIDGSVVGGHYRIMVNDKCIAEIKNAELFNGKNLEVYDEEDANLVVAIFQAIVNIVYQ